MTEENLNKDAKYLDIDEEIEASYTEKCKKNEKENGK